MLARVALAVAVMAVAGGCKSRKDERGAGPAIDDAAPASQALSFGETVYRTLGPSGEQLFDLGEVKSGAYLEVTVDQLGVDVRLSLDPAQGPAIAEADDVAGTSGIEQLFAIAPATGSLRLSVRAELGAGEPASYRLRASTSQQPSADQRDRAAAARHELDARRAIDEAGDALPRAAELFGRAAEIWRRLGDRRRRALALEGKGRALDLAGDNQASLEAREAALLIQTEIRDHAGSARTHYGLGRVRTSLGQLDAAMAHYDHAILLSQDAGDPVMVAKASHNLAEMYELQGDLEAALSLLETSRETFERLGRVQFVAVELFALGRIRQQLGDVDSARDHYERSLRLLRANNLVWDEGHVLQALGSLYLGRLAEPERARDTFERARAASSRAGDRRGELDTAILQGWTELAAGDPAKAGAFFAEAKAAVESMSERVAEPAVWFGIAEARRAAGDTTGAFEALDRAQKLASALGQRPLESQIRAARSRALAAAGRSREALAEVRAAIDVAESLRARLSARSHRETYFASVRDHYDLYIELLMAAGDQRRAFAASERARARTLVEMLDTSGANLGATVDPDVAKSIGRLRGQLRRLEQSGASEEQIVAVVRKIELLRQRLRDKSGEYGALVDGKGAGVASVQRTLPANAAVIEYALGPERSTAWVVTRTDFHSYRLPPRAEIEAASRKVYELLTARNRRDAATSAGDHNARVAEADGQLAAALDALSAMILAPMAASLSGTALVVVPDGALQYVPFAALAIPGESDPLIERFDIRTVSSASLLSRRTARDNSGKVMVFADPVFSAADRRLPDPDPSSAVAYKRLRFSRVEADAIAETSDRVELIEDFDATEQRVVAAAGSAEVLHFATHGVVNSRHPELSSLVLSLVGRDGAARDGELRLHEIYNLKLSARLVVLSGCETALGREIRGEGLVGLVRGFLYAGADQVVASLWQIHDRATAQLMARFYRALLAEGLEPAAAMRSAQRSLRAESRWKSPYYWAAFVVAGG